MTVNDFALYVLFPYAAITAAVGAGIYRFVRYKTSVSSLSSQFLETEVLFRGSALWHYGIVVVLLAHILALIFPRFWRLIGSSPPRLYGMEMSGLVFSVSALAGLGILMTRRIANRRVRRATSFMDWVLETVLLVQVAAGFLVALLYRWGSQWYLSTAVPWVVSLLLFAPRADLVARLPWTVKLHFLNGFLVLALLPFSRLIHAVSLSITYLFRPYQVVIWETRRKTKR
jgi:nitrate reductase gamma subunit